MSQASLLEVAASPLHLPGILGDHFGCSRELLELPLWERFAWHALGRAPALHPHLELSWGEQDGPLAQSGGVHELLGQQDDVVRVGGGAQPRLIQLRNEIYAFCGCR